MDFLISQNLPSLIGSMPDFRRAMNPSSPVLMDNKGTPRTTETATFINPMPTPFTMSDQFMLAPTITMRDGMLQKMSDEQALDTALQRGAYTGYIPLPGILTPQGLRETEYTQRLPGLISDYIASQRGLR
tara:strand:+ start:57 stop:446 length:390 start_codon:yes stop_codon:yes gene_type:complete